MGTTNSGAPAASPPMAVSGHPAHVHVRRPLSPHQPNRFLHEIEVHRVIETSSGFEVVFEPQSIDEVLIVFDTEHSGVPTCVLVSDSGASRDLRLVPAPTQAGHFHAMVGGDVAWSRIRVRPSPGTPAKLLRLKFIGRPSPGHVTS
jgi:hypothetical protein